LTWHRPPFSKTAPPAQPTNPHDRLAVDFGGTRFTGVEDLRRMVRSAS
jgi:hypothetical protein